MYRATIGPLPSADELARASLEVIARLDRMAQRLDRLKASDDVVFASMPEVDMTPEERLACAAMGQTHIEKLPEFLDEVMKVKEGRAELGDELKTNVAFDVMDDGRVRLIFNQAVKWLAFEPDQLDALVGTLTALGAQARAKKAGA